MITDLAFEIQHSLKSLITLTIKPGFVLAEKICLFLFILLTVHLGITLVNDQLDAQFFFF